MPGRKEHSDSRLNVARYRVDRLAEEMDGADAAGAVTADPEESDAAGRSTMDARAQYVELAVQQAIRRGEFDDLPGAGRPIADLGQPYDPDWWIRRKIQREELTGLGPPALTLRTEDRGLDARLDAAFREDEVRELLRDFNARVIDARRQLQGGPPVVTSPRDVDEEVARWRERREARLAAVRAAATRVSAARAVGHRRRDRATRAALVDVAFVVAFVLIGRASHAEDGVLGFLGTLWPFVAGLAVGWVASRPWRDPFRPVRAGVPVWLATVGIGLLLRVVGGQGVQPSFIVVTTVVLGAFLVGWRMLVAPGVHRRSPR